MKLKVQFGSETRFDQPIRRKTRTRAQWSPGIQVSSRTVTIAGRRRPIKRRIDQWNFSGSV